MVEKYSEKGRLKGMGALQKTVYYNRVMGNLSKTVKVSSLFPYFVSVHSFVSSDLNKIQKT